MVGQEEVVAREEVWSLAVVVVSLHGTLEISCQPLSTFSCLRVWMEEMWYYTDTGIVHTIYSSHMQVCQYYESGNLPEILFIIHAT